ncbi:thiamine phosphate synthase [Oceanicaulis alexandrii]|uniref:thiamine phosphate synthase n=1 Tax=Oceanicaulis alexandrii TaxID=153233 RepID=UPI002354A338|nr:thiamine phosphate synthase [Oceanicaulis alexandrii]
MAMTGYDGAARLARLADALDGPRAGLPGLFCFTDPNRTPDLKALAHALPEQAGLILRLFGRDNLHAQAAELVTIQHDKGGLCLIAAEPDLAAEIGADGVHWPERWLTGANVRRSHGLISTSAHSPSALRRAQTLADLAFVSTAFHSHSPSATRPMGAFRLSAFARHAEMPVFALGGVNIRTIKRLKGLGISGIGAVDAVSGETQT